MARENPKHKQGDGAGFGRLRAEQAKRSAFMAMIGRAHPFGNIYIDQVREYAGSQVVFYRREVETWEEARIAVFLPTAVFLPHHDREWLMHSDIIANTTEK